MNAGGNRDALPGVVFVSFSACVELGLLHRRLRGQSLIAFPFQFQAV